MDRDGDIGDSVRSSSVLPMDDSEDAESWHDDADIRSGGRQPADFQYCSSSWNRHDLDLLMVRQKVKLEMLEGESRIKISTQNTRKVQKYAKGNEAL